MKRAAHLARRATRHSNKRDAEKTRAALLAAGAELFAKHGFAGTTADMIARRSRVNKALVNYYFRTKEGLYEEIVGSTLRPLSNHLQSQQADLRPDEQLRHFIEIFAVTHVKHPYLSTMILREFLSGNRTISGRLLPHFIGIVRYVSDILERGIKEKLFRPVDPFLTHLSLVSTLVYFFATAQARRHLLSSADSPVRDPTVDEYVRHVTELFLRGLGADKSLKGGN
ncbi:MAG TPA: TetR/AcrR family transcriptional regulator [Bdellovibrionota bacterium]|nr:TetR/AcrR family transcriptional regulator [Bdellovibrionota bacterium]